MNIQQRMKKEIAREERYLLRRGWKVERHYELADDRDKRDWRNWYDLHTWTSPVSKRKVSRMGAVSEQCARDGHRKPMNYKVPLNMPLVVCSRCRAAFGIGHVSNEKLTQPRHE